MLRLCIALTGFWYIVMAPLFGAHMILQTLGQGQLLFSCKATGSCTTLALAAEDTATLVMLSYKPYWWGYRCYSRRIPYSPLPVKRW